jgi:hypothetical protein
MNGKGQATGVEPALDNPIFSERISAQVEKDSRTAEPVQAPFAAVETI